MSEPKQSFPFYPLGNRVVIDPIPVEEKTKGGIFIAPKQTNMTPTQGIVVATGPGKMLESGEFDNIRVMPGDHVYWNKFAGTEIRIGGKIYLVMREPDIIGVLKSE